MIGYGARGITAVDDDAVACPCVAVGGRACDGGCDKGGAGAVDSDGTGGLVNAGYRIIIGGVGHGTVVVGVEVDSLAGAGATLSTLYGVLVEVAGGRRGAGMVEADVVEY